MSEGHVHRRDPLQIERRLLLAPGERGGAQAGADRSKRRALLFAALTFVPLLAGTIGAYAVTSDLSSSLEDSRYEDHASSVISAMTEGIEIQFTQLEGLRGFFDLVGDPGRQAFDRYVQTSGWIERTPEVQGVAFLRHLTIDEVPAFESARRSEGFPDFSVYPAPTGRHDLFVVDYLVPFEGNERAFGYDVASDPTRREALLDAMESGEARATSPVLLRQDPERAPGLLLLLPWYSDPSAGSVGDRREDIRGIVDVAYRGNEFVQDLLLPADVASIDIEVHDVGPWDEPDSWMVDPANLFFDSDGDPAEVALGVDPVDGGPRMMEVAGRAWAVHVGRPADLLSLQERIAPWVAVVVGTLINILLTGTVYLAASRGTRAEVLARRMALKSQQAEARESAILESAPDAIVIVDATGRIVRVNAQTEAVFGYTRDEMLGETVEMLQPQRFRERHVGHRADFARDPHVRAMGTGLELYGQRKDGAEFPVEISLSPLPGRGGEGETLVMAAIRDATERKETERELEARAEEVRRTAAALAEAQEVAHIGSFELDALGDEVTWSDELYRLVGLPVGTKLTYEMTVDVVHPEDREALARKMQELLDSGGAFEMEHRVRHPSGQVRWLQTRTIADKDADGRVVRLHGTTEDITERKLAEDRIRESLAEKEALLKEIHHRVKNNLQVVASLLSLQAGYAREEETRSLFRESRDRVNAMALVHEKLYRSRDLANVDAASYVADLLADLRRAFGAETGVGLEHEVSPGLLLDADLATSLGLIMNELVSNAYKHAFDGRREGLVRVELRREGDSLTLEVRDDGVGVPAGLDPAKASSLGIQLVRALARQVEGDLTFERDAGTLARVTMPRAFAKREHE